RGTGIRSDVGERRQPWASRRERADMGVVVGVDAVALVADDEPRRDVVLRAERLVDVDVAADQRTAIDAGKAVSEQMEVGVGAHHGLTIPPVASERMTASAATSPRLASSSVTTPGCRPCRTPERKAS